MFANTIWTYLLWSPLNSRDSDPGSQSRLSSPLPTAAVGAFNFYCGNTLALSSLVDGRLITSGMELLMRGGSETNRGNEHLIVGRVSQYSS